MLLLLNLMLLMLMLNYVLPEARAELFAAEVRAAKSREEAAKSREEAAKSRAKLRAKLPS